MASRKSIVDFWSAARLDSITEEIVDDYRADSLRPVLFLFYTLETVANMFCLAYHVSGFQVIDPNVFDAKEHLIHFFYLGIFYAFMVITLFQSVDLCTGTRPITNIELIKASAATIAFLFVSLATLWNAERQFYMFNHQLKQEKRPDNFINYEPVHPFFLYMRSQAIYSLACGVIYLLHTCLMLDYKLTTERTNNDYMPINLFVVGSWVDTKLQKYKWFQELCSYENIPI